MYITKRHCNCAVYVYCIYLRNGAGKIQYIFLLDCYPAVYIPELSSKLKIVKLILPLNSFLLQKKARLYSWDLYNFAQ